MGNGGYNLITASLLAFIYAVLATPFLVWALFRYNELSARKDYIQRVELELAEQKTKLEELCTETSILLNEINSIRLKAGFNGKEKNFL
jgi:hypothetical protein